MKLETELFEPYHGTLPTFRILHLYPESIMSLTIMRRIKFCAGHRLHKHGGKCEHFHGHNYMADFYVTGHEVDDVGRVIDFAELKKLFKGWLDENWDHGFVLNKDDENGLAAVKIVVPCRYYVLPYNPTSENMATYLLREVCPELLAGKGDSSRALPLGSGSGLSATAVDFGDGATALLTKSISCCVESLLHACCC